MLKIKYLIILPLLYLIPEHSISQTVIRQSIGTIGNTYQSPNLTIQQSTGQPYQTKHGQSSWANQGFIQPISTGLTEINSTFNIHIQAFPNPTNSEISFLLKEQVSDVKLTLYSITGQVIFTKELTLLNGYKLDCRNIKSGNYLIRITDKTGNTYNSRFTKI